MSQETTNWLNTMILSGMESVFGKPWWDDGRDDRSNHFDGAIPIERIQALFGFLVNAVPVWTKNAAGELFEVEGFKAQVPDNQNAVFGIHSDSFQGHQFNEWLVDGPAKLVNGRTGFSSSGLLKNGAQAWVQVTVPEEWKTPQGVNFRSNLLATTAFDGSCASTYKLTNQLTICDNTRERALASDGLVYRVKHTRNSAFKLKDAQDAFKLLEQESEAFAAEIATLCEQTVSEAQWQAFLAKLVPMPEKTGLDINKRDYSTRTATIAANKREKLNELYRQDGRVAPWQGTAFGVLQAVNTFNIHEATQRNVKDHRAARIMENVLNGKLAEQDVSALKFLELVCA